MELLSLRRTGIRAINGSFIVIPNGDIRVVENQTCRWSRHVCISLPPDEKKALGCDALPVPDTIQERAWSSPIWYTPKS